MNDNSKYGPTLLRLVLGLLFVIPGISKLMNPDMIIGMLGGMGFPAASFFGWVLLLSEIIFGLAVLVGLKVRWAVWPLVAILAVAIVMVHIPALAASPMGVPNLLFHVLGVAALISLSLSGAGAIAVDN